jgi:non-ribosomal peptide synthetase component E (peptide arylation enzyme)
MSFNLAVILSETAHAAPDRPVAVYDGGRLTYRELDQASGLLSAALTASGIEPADRVALQLPKNTLGKVLKDELARMAGGPA